jgi:MFS family permease
VGAAHACPQGTERPAARAFGIRFPLSPQGDSLQRKETHHEARVPVLDALRKYPKIIALAAGAFIVVNGTFYILINYVLAYGKVLGVAETTLLSAVLVSAIVAIVALLGFAALSDHVGRRKVYLAGALLSGLWGAPLFLLIGTKVAILIFLAISVGQMFLSMMYGPQAAFFSELFTPEMRYSGASLGYQIGSVFGGAFAPIIASGLFAAYKRRTKVGCRLQSTSP